MMMRHRLLFLPLRPHRRLSPPVLPPQMAEMKGHNQRFLRAILSNQFMDGHLRSKAVRDMSLSTKMKKGFHSKEVRVTSSESKNLQRDSQMKEHSCSREVRGICRVTMHHLSNSVVPLVVDMFRAKVH